MGVGTLGYLLPHPDLDRGVDTLDREGVGTLDGG